jgi:recombination protein RecR
MQYPAHLIKLIQVLKKFPGVGTKSAERFAFHLLNWPSEHLQDLGESILTAKQRLKYCSDCGCLMDEERCFFCNLPRRDTQTVCILATAREVFAIEDTHEYRGLYHVLGGVLSPLENRGPEHLSVPRLKKRIQTLNITEVVIALDSTLEGDATALYLKQELADLPVRISRLAFGLPMGSSLEYVDGGTLARALTGRNQF